MEFNYEGVFIKLYKSYWIKSKKPLNVSVFFLNLMLTFIHISALAVERVDTHIFIYLYNIGLLKEFII